MKTFTDQDSLKQFDTGLAVLKFEATWCQPCKAMQPSLEQLEAEMPSVTFAKCDIEQAPAAATFYNVRSVPTVVLLKDGNIVGVQTGMKMKSALSSAIKAAFGAV